MGSRLERTFEGDHSSDLLELVTSEEANSENVGLADSLEQKRRALLVVEVAQLLNISERQVYKLVAGHRIPCFKIGVSIRFGQRLATNARDTPAKGGRPSLTP